MRVRSGWNRRIMNRTAGKNTLILGFTLMVVMLGYGMVMPIMPFYIEMLGGRGREIGWLISIYSLMQLLCAPFWGRLSDRAGRKPVIALGMTGYALSLLLFGMAESFRMVFIARTLAGILSSAALPTAMAYVGDTETGDNRSGGMGKIGAALGLGMVFGPLLSSLLSRWSLSLPFFAGAGLAASSVIMVIILLPEPRTRRPAREPRSRPALGPVIFGPAGVTLLLILVISLGLSQFQGIIGLYALEKYDSTPSGVGLIWIVTGLVLIIGQGVITGPLTRRFGEIRVIRAALAAGSLGFLGIALSSEFVQVLVAIGFLIFALSLLSPALNGYISRQAGNNQGTVMGLNSSASSLGRIIGPFAAGILFDWHRESPFFCGAAIFAGAFLLALVLLGRKARAIPQPPFESSPR